MARKVKRSLIPHLHWKRTLLCLMGVAAVLTCLELTNTTHIFHKNTPAANVVVTVGTPVKTPSTKNPASTESQPNKILSSNSSVQNSGATDNHGASSSITDPQQWVVSKSGNITVKQPTANATVKTSSVVSGSAKVSEVQYRLIDDSKGVLATGPISVVNGNFSATLNFTHSASSGRLDIFSYDPNNAGVEINEIQIAVKF